jgi:hypothetical protein
MESSLPTFNADFDVTLLDSGAVYCYERSKGAVISQFLVKDEVALEPLRFAFKQIRLRYFGVGGVE